MFKPSQSKSETNNHLDSPKGNKCADSNIFWDKYTIVILKSEVQSLCTLAFYI